MTDPLVRHRTMMPAALEEEAATEQEQVREFLAFSLAREAYALPLSSIREIVKPPPITEVPRASRDVLGIISVRGRVTTVVDMRRRLRVTETPFTRGTRILLVEAAEEIMGLLVDRVLQVFRLQAEEIEMAAVVGGDTAEYVIGIGRPQAGRGPGRFRDEEASPASKDDILILLDPKALLKR